MTLPHELLMISAGPLQLPKHQFYMFERLAILNHSLCSVRGPAVTSAAPTALRPSFYKSLVFRSITFRVVSVTGLVVTTLTLFRCINETSCVARRRFQRRRARTEQVAGRLEGTAEFEGGFS